jgi:membrane-associated phospholipid phosphatase
MRMTADGGAADGVTAVTESGFLRRRRRSRAGPPGALGDAQGAGIYSRPMRAHATWVLLLLCGCAQAPGPARPWGSRVVLLPKPANAERALWRAALDPWVWVPAVGAALFAIDDWDDDVADWAADEHPIFGSRRTARTAGDAMRNVLRVEWPLSLLATPSGELFSREWLANKARGAAVELGAYALNGGVTLGLKKAVGRERPDHSDAESFPSGHATESFALMTLADRNLDATPMPAPLRVSVQVANALLATATAWSRVEARKHHPADVLAGAAIGRLTSALVHDTWLAPEEPEVAVDARAGPDGVSLGLAWRF